MSKKSPQRGSIKTRSQISCSSKQSGSSSASKTAAALARAKAEAAFAGEEIALKLQQAELEASTQLQRTRLEVCLDKVRVEKKAAAAEAKAEVLEAALMQDSDEVLSQIDVPNDDPEKRTKEYVEGAFQGTNTPDEAFVDAHTSNVDLQAIQPTLTIDSHQRISGPGIKLPGKSSAALKTTIHTLTAQSQNKTMVDGIKGNLAKQAEQCSTVPKMEQNTCYTEHPLDSPYGGEGYRDRFDNSHLSYKGVQPTQGDGSKDMSDLVRFIARRELVSTGLTHFNDRPECFRAWKSSFLNAIRDLNLSSSEHLDLLVKWLGKDSAEHARRIRTVHVNYPEYGLRAVWDRLNEYYGAPEIIENSLFKRLESFPKIPNKDYHKLRELGDLLMEIQAAKEDGDLLGLSYLDTPRGVNPVVQKLPFYLQEKWLTIGFQYKQDYKVFYPPFSLFVDFVCNQARMRSDPSFMLAAFSNDSTEHGRQMLKTDGQRAFAVLKTGVSSKTFSAHHSGPSVQTNASPTSKFTTTADPSKHCLLHDKPHPLSKCRGFRGKPIDERKSILKKHGICYKCCRALHLARNCEEDIICAECGSKTHVTALHPEPAPWLSCPDTPTPENGGEKDNNQGAAVSTTCTEICGKEKSGRSCSKVCLVRVFPAGCPDAAVKMYVILDDQSNRSLARSEFFDLFDISGLPTPYFLKTCAGTMETEGRQASGFVVEPVDRSIQLSLPTLIECNEIPNNRSEIPTPEVALGHGHLKHLTKHIPKLDQQAPIALLLGRDIIRVHKVRRQVNGPHNAPFAQKLDLGWVIVGDVCIGDVHKPPVVSSYYTNILRNGRPSLFEPCPRSYIVKEKYCGHGPPSVPLLNKGCSTSGVQSFSDSDVFQQTKDDDSEAPSIEDIQFLVIMDREVHQDEGNNWVAPLPFRSQRQRLPDNRAQALERFFSLQRTFRKKPEMKEQFLAFMEKIFQNGHAEPAPLLQPGEEHWYLPCFGVYHPKKPSQIRVVFDSSAQHKGLSLNQVLLTGPDLNNNLIGVLLRFRKEPIAFTVDIQQMFHCFVVRPEDRNFLRFLWFKDNNPEKDIEEFRMKVHVFGNSPSPAVAIYCLRRAAELGQRDFGEDARQFVVRDFYVDDGLKSLPTPDAAISLLKRTQEMLACSNLRLHKLASNSKEVMEAFPCDDHATNLKDLDLDSGNLPTQRSLGLLWDLDSDSFMYQVQDERKPFTRRGILSTVNSLYDPLGFVSPITIEGKALLRELTADSPDWDAPLPSEKEKLWEGWRDSLQELQHFKIPRSYTHVPPSAAKKTELCIFSDASERAVAAVAYLKTVDADENCYTGLVASKAKLAPRPGYTIPRLELCAAVMAVNLAEVITSEMDTTFDAVTFFTDSKVVLGYIYNEKRRFHVFVHNRVQRIRRSTLPQQWRYVRTENNPADIATRPIPAERLKDTVWFTGPAFLSQPRDRLPDDQTFELLEPECDPEIKPQVTTLLTAVTQHLGSQRFSHFSCWMTLVRAVGALIHIIQGFKKEQGETSEDCKGWHWCPRHLSGDVLSQSTTVILRTVQHETYGKELELLASNKSIPKNSLLWSLDPFIDQNGLLRVGGRLNRASLGSDEKKPLILPGRHHVATLIARHFHKETQHQGRHFTEGAIRAAGYWILGGKRCVSKLIFECVTCRRLRKKCEVQKMADLPPDRLSMEPPFSNVGLDVFGPWSVSARRTRGGHAESKRWAVLFTCLSVRAIHIEVIESLDSSSFINAFRRFLAIRGPVKHIRSDRGTNFIGASKALGIPSNANGEAVEKFLSEQGCSWTFNPPHSSHMGGVWERMIGVTRRILDSMFLQMGSSKLTHEVLITFLAEVTAIVNNRPLVPVSTDPMDPFILTPATLLTQKAGPCPVPTEEFGDKVLFRQQWRRVQSLSNTFWDRWRKQYLSTLQTRKKWTCEQPSLKPGNVVLLRDNQSKRNDWPLGIVTEVYPSKDGHVRKVQVQVTKKDGKKLFLRPWLNWYYIYVSEPLFDDVIKGRQLLRKLESMVCSEQHSDFFHSKLVFGSIVVLPYSNWLQ